MIIFYIGCCLGSFCNVISYRLIRNEDWLFNRSYSDCCFQQLSFIHILPIFSYFALKGRCPYCHEKISRQHLLVEIMSGLVFYLLFFYSNNWILKTLIMMVLLVISLMDLKQLFFDGKLLLLLFLFSFIYAFVCHVSVIDRILGMTSISLPLLFVKKYIGDGDLWILSIMGMSLKCYGLFFSFFIAVNVSMIYSMLMLILKKNNPKDPIAFCPFLSIGVFFAFMFVS